MLLRRHKLENEVKINYINITWQELKKLATEKGINTKGLKKAEIIAELQRLEV